MAPTIDVNFRGLVRSPSMQAQKARFSGLASTLTPSASTDLSAYLGSSTNAGVLTHDQYALDLAQYGGGMICEVATLAGAFVGSIGTDVEDLLEAYRQSTYSLGQVIIPFVEGATIDVRQHTGTPDDPNVAGDSSNFTHRRYQLHVNSIDPVLMQANVSCSYTLTGKTGVTKQLDQDFIFAATALLWTGPHTVAVHARLKTKPLLLVSEGSGVARGDVFNNDIRSLTNRFDAAGSGDAMRASFDAFRDSMPVNIPTGIVSVYQTYSNTPSVAMYRPSITPMNDGLSYSFETGQYLGSVSVRIPNRMGMHVSCSDRMTSNVSTRPLGLFPHPSHTLSGDVGVYGDAFSDATRSDYLQSAPSRSVDIVPDTTLTEAQIQDQVDDLSFDESSTLATPFQAPTWMFPAALYPELHPTKFAPSLLSAVNRNSLDAVSAKQLAAYIATYPGQFQE